MNISFVIPAYNEEKYIGRCVASIIKNRTEDFFEIIVVDNASTDHTAEVAKKISADVRVVHETEKGLTKARQCGLMAAKGELVAYLDADTEMPAQWPRTVKREFEKNKNLVCLSGPPHYYDLSPLRRLVAEGLWTVALPAYWFAGYATYGANFVAKREALLKIGGFDKKIVFHGEDTDIAWRLSKVGKVKFKMGFFILGSARRMNNEGLIKSFIIYGINFLWVAFKHKPYSDAYQDIR